MVNPESAGLRIYGFLLSNKNELFGRIGATIRDDEESAFGEGLLRRSLALTFSVGVAVSAELGNARFDDFPKVSDEDACAVTESGHEGLFCA
jgi:hypothetical protein